MRNAKSVAPARRTANATSDPAMSIARFHKGNLPAANEIPGNANNGAVPPLWDGKSSGRISDVFLEIAAGKETSGMKDI
jgi:hypothetical protein